MTTANIRQKLYEYIRFADDEKVKAFYTIIAPEITAYTAWWKEKSLIAEMDATNAAIESGQEKTIPWSEVKRQLMETSKKTK